MTGPTSRSVLHTAPLLLAILAGCATPARAPAGAPAPEADGPPPVEREFRGVWIASVSNLDWPSRPGLPVDSQKAELVRMLDRAQELRLNVVILQVRPAADALYASTLEPWSEYLTGEQGRAPAPLYDPLAFAIEQAHVRGLELHAWFNPYRARHPSSRGPAAPTHISRANPELVRSYGSYLWMDPGEDAVRQRSLDVIMDVVRRYDVDGVHLDDYFYPYRERGPDGRELEFPDSASYARYRAAGGTLDRSDWRRANVDRFVAELYDAVKREKSWVKVGISPIGTWRPNVVPQLGGFDAFEQIHADARKWLMEGTLDYFVPQLYWPIARTDVSFPVLLDWWVRQNPLGRGLYAGLIPGNVNVDTAGRAGWRPDEIIGQIYITRGRPGAEGHVHFRMGSLMPDGAYGSIAGADTLTVERVEAMRAQQRRVQARRDTLANRLRDEAYARPALVPAMPWLGDAPPSAPRATMVRDPAGTRLILEPPHGRPAFLWVVQSRWSDGWRTEIVPASRRDWIVGSVAGTPVAGAATAGAATAARPAAPEAVWVSAADRLGNQSAPVRASPAPPQQQTRPVQAARPAGPADAAAPSSSVPPPPAALQQPELPPGVIPHADWHAAPPLGYAADADRRNLRPGDTFGFRDLEVGVIATSVESAPSPPAPTDSVRLRLRSGGATEERTVAEGAAFDWNGYRVAVVAIHAPGELGGGLTALEVATVASLPPEVARSSRAGGAELRLRVPHEITRITLHHTGFPEPLRPEDDPVRKLRELQAWGAADRNWWDLPYHFLIDLDGNIYEGRDWRYKGDTNTTYEPRGHFLISVMGNYEIQQPAQSQLDAIAHLMAWALDRFDLTTDRIGGHYEFATTACPGANLRPLLENGTLVRMAEARRMRQTN